MSNIIKIATVVVILGFVSSCARDPAVYDLKSPCVSGAVGFDVDSPCVKRIPTDNMLMLA